MKPESTVLQVIDLATKLAHKQLLGFKPGTATELSETSIAAMIIVSVILETLPLEQKQQVLETLRKL
jgi:hypothetical protein